MSTVFSRRQVLLGGLTGAAVVGLTAACGNDSGDSGDGGDVGSSSSTAASTR